MDDKLIQAINEKTPILDLVSEFVSLSKRGKNYMGLCPFHQEKTPSFSVSPEKNIAKCMSCGEGGTPINFYRKIKNVSFEEAAVELALRAGIEIKQQRIQKDPFEKEYALMDEVAKFYQFNLFHSEKGKDVLNYLEQREIKGKTIEHFRLGYAPPYGDNLYQMLKSKSYDTSMMIKLGVVKQADDGKYYDLFSERLIFPITNPKGMVVGLSGRTLNPKDLVKYINSPETPIFKKGSLLYHLNEALPDIRKEKHLILYEGFFDVISSYQAGIMEAVASMGTALTPLHAKLIKSYTNSVIVAYDGDKAGIKASIQAIETLTKEGLKVEVLAIPEKMDPDDFIKAYGAEKFDDLFSTFLKDPYQFRYDAYRLGKDLKNANDIQSFKKDVLAMLSGVDPTIQSIYLKKLSQDLGVPVEQITRRVEPKVKSDLPTHIQKKMKDRYARAEYSLIFAMLRSKKYAQEIQKQLKITDFADHIAASIRQKISSYYETNENMVITDLLDRLPTDERNFLEGVILEDWLWKMDLEIKEEDIKHFTKLVKDANLKRRLNYINDKIKAQDGKLKPSEIEERDKILKALKNHQEV